MSTPEHRVIRLTEQMDAELEAIQRFILRSTIPLLTEQKAKDPVILGTGTLFRINERYFIITARHLFDDEDLQVLAVPDSTRGESFIRLRQVDYSRPVDKDVDVAVLEIKDSEGVNAIKKNWNFLTLANVRITPPRNSVWIVGYPVESFRRDGSRRVMGSVTVLTEVLAETPPEARQPVRAGLDFFFLYEKVAHMPNKGPGNTPEMPGVSGASIWELDEPKLGALWLPEKFAKAIAIQSSYKHSKYLRAQSWAAVAQSLYLMDEELRVAVSEATGLQAK